MNKLKTYMMKKQIETLEKILRDYEGKEEHRDLVDILSFVKEEQLRKIWWWSKLDVERALEWHNENLPEEERIPFTEELAHNVLDRMEEIGDASIGISWDTVTSALEWVLE